jgi:SAM-dependent methyltransferase
VDSANEVSLVSSCRILAILATADQAVVSTSLGGRKEPMDQGDYNEQNRVKASFDGAYTAPTPHQYFLNMTAVDYQMADYMNPYISAVVDASMTPQEPVRVLDVGCSYGMSGALLKTDCAYRDLAKFYRDEASSEYTPCVAESQRWLDSHVMREDVAVVGFDSSEEAIRFAAASRMIDKGIALNLEAEKSALTADEAHLIQECDVLLSTGAIGYVTDKTVNPILDEFGNNARGALGPVAVMSVLELFDPAPIAEAFTEHGYRFRELPVRMPQRRFVDEEEREGVIETLRKRGVHAKESEHQMFAGLCIAAKPGQFDALTECVTEAIHGLPSEVSA